MPWNPISWRLEDGWPATSGPWLARPISKTEAKKKAAETTRKIVAKAEAKARRSPGTVAAVAAGAGLVVGLLARRGRG